MGNPVVRFDIGCKDKEATAAFYREVFGWEISPGPYAQEVLTGGGKGIEGSITALGHEPHNYVMVYMEVEDADAACAAIEAQGGTVAIGPIDIPDGDDPQGKGRFAWFKDPEGNLLAICEPPAQAARDA